MNITWYDWAGYIGVALVLLAFFLLQAHKLRGNGLIYQLMNILGAIGVMLSLLFGSFNAAAFVMQLAWLLIGVYGIVRGAKRRREAREAGRPAEPW
jgi:paired small multidrug resistance pump